MGQTIRLVIEQPAANSLGRAGDAIGVKPAEPPRKAKF
jgi:hypothetical protein